MNIDNIIAIAHALSFSDEKIYSSVKLFFRTNYKRKHRLNPSASRAIIVTSQRYLWQY